MGKNHEGCERGFYRTARAWYGKHVVRRQPEITFGMYHKDGGTTGEMSVVWEEIADRTVPRLMVFDDAWDALASFTDLIQRLGEADDKKITEEEFAAILAECGFKDLTPYKEGR